MDIKSYIIGMQAGKTPTEEVEATYEENGDYVLTPPEGKAFDKVTIKTKVQSDFKLNVSYGETEPEDVSHLWVKTGAPNKLAIGGREGSEIIDDTVPQYFRRVAYCVIDNIAYIVSSTSGRNKLYTYNFLTNEYKEYNEDFDLPVYTEGASVTNIGNVIYIMGGEQNTASSSNLSNSYNIYTLDLNTLAVTLLAEKLPTYIDYSACASVGDNIYIFGGRPGNSFKTTCIKFDTVTRTFTTIGSLPNGSADIGVVVIDKKIYLVGGRRTLYYTSNQFICYDTETSAFTTLANLPLALEAPACGSIDGKIFVAGGYYEGSKDDYYSDYIYVYNIATNKWTRETRTIYAPNNGSMYYAMGNKLIMVGGYTANSTPRTEIINMLPPVENGDIFIDDSKGTKFKFSSEGLLQLETYIDNVYKGNEEGVGLEVDAAVYKDGQWVNI